MNPNQNLHKPNSRWNTRPNSYYNTPGNTNPYNLLLYVKGVKKSDGEGCDNDKIKEALDGIEWQANDYPPGNTRSVRGNNLAGELMAEFDDVINLAKLHEENFDIDRQTHADWLRPLISDNFGVVFVDEYSRQRFMRLLVTWGLKWAASRYRELSHALRDDYLAHETMPLYDATRTTPLAEATNSIIHHSSIAEDAILRRIGWWYNEVGNDHSPHIERLFRLRNRISTANVRNISKKSEPPTLAPFPTR